MWGLLSFLFLGGRIANEKALTMSANMDYKQRQKSCGYDLEYEYSLISKYRYEVGRIRRCEEMGLSYNCMISAALIQNPNLGEYNADKIVWAYMVAKDMREHGKSVSFSLRFDHNGDPYSLRGNTFDYSYLNPEEMSELVLKVMRYYNFGKGGYFLFEYDDYLGGGYNYLPPKKPPAVPQLPRIIGFTEYQYMKDTLEAPGAVLSLDDDYENKVIQAEEAEQLFWRSLRTARKYPYDFDIHTQMLKWRYNHLLVDEYLTYAYDILDNRSAREENEMAQEVVNGWKYKMCHPDSLLSEEMRYIGGVSNNIIPLVFPHWVKIKYAITKKVKYLIDTSTHTFPNQYPSPVDNKILEEYKIRKMTDEKERGDA